MCELCGNESRHRICELCLEELDSIDASVVNRLLNSIDIEEKPLPKMEQEEYEDVSERVL